MKNEITGGQREDYERDGFLVVEEFLSPDELLEWREAFDNALVERGRQRFSYANAHADRGADPDDVDEGIAYYARALNQRVNLWQTDESMRRLIRSAELAKLPCHLAGVDGLRIGHDQALVKEAYANPTAFHLDVPYWSFTSPDAISIWVALDDVTVHNGCLYYVPGSHRNGSFDNVSIGKDIGALFSVYPQWADVVPVACPVPAGGALLHNGLTFHGAGANMTPGRRRAMVCCYMPDGSTFNGQANVLPPDYLATLQRGDPLDNEAENPLVYSRAQPPTGRAPVADPLTVHDP